MLFYFRGLLRLQQKIYVVTLALSYFTTKTWLFENTNFLGLNDKIPDVDRKEFDYDFKNVDVVEFITNAAIGSQKYLFNVESDRQLIAKAVYKR